MSPVASVVYAVLGSDISITGLEGEADPAVELLKEIEGYACNDCNGLHEKSFLFNIYRRITMCNWSTHFPKMCSGV